MADQWRLGFQNVWFSLGDNHSFTKTVLTRASQWRRNFQNVWFSLGENDISIKTYHAMRGTCMATFQENRCARMQIMYQSEDLRAPLSSRLFKRILVRECRKCLRTTVVQEACHLHLLRESLCENKNCKNAKNDMSTFDENPYTGTTTTKEPIWGGNGFTCTKTILFLKCMKFPRRE